MSATTTQLLCIGEFCKLRYDTIPVKKYICKRFFLHQYLKNAKFWVVTVLSQMSDMCTTKEKHILIFFKDPMPMLGDICM
jgi:hypothetical protein